MPQAMRDFVIGLAGNLVAAVILPVLGVAIASMKRPLALKQLTLIEVPENTGSVLPGLRGGIIALALGVAAVMFGVVAVMNSGLRGGRSSQPSEFYEQDAKSALDDARRETDSGFRAAESESENALTD